MEKTIQEFVDKRVVLKYEDYRDNPEECRQRIQRLIKGYGKGFVKKTYFVGIPTMYKALYIVGQLDRDPIEFSYLDGEMRHMGTAHVHCKSPNGYYIGIWLDTRGEITALWEEENKRRRQKYKTKNTKEFLSVCRELKRIHRL